MKLEKLNVIFFIILFILINNCTPSKVPAIKVDGLKYKFGKVNEGEDVVFTFIFSNPGEKDLVISNLEVSCYCVVVKDYDSIVKPGEKGRIYGVMETEGFRGDLLKRIKVTTNVPHSEPVILSLEGTVLSVGE